MTEPAVGDGDSALRFIAGFKLLEAIMLVAAGFAALGLVEPQWQHAIVEWLDALSLREGRRLTSQMAATAMTMLGATTVRRLVSIATGCFVYGGVFMVEAAGLWLRKRWAEYLTTIATASLLPFEIIEVVHRQSAARIATLALNLLIVGYLIWRLAERSDGTGRREA